MTEKTCCNCGKHALIFPYVCSECLDKIKGSTHLAAVQRLEEAVRIASKILMEKGFTEEAKSIISMI